MTANVETPAQIAAIRDALARSEVYLWLSRLFRHPDESLWAALQEPTFAGLDAVLEAGSAELGDALRPLLADLRATVAAIDLAHLQSEHRRIFGHIESAPCPPYETRYGSRHLFQQTQQLADIAGFYRAFGLDVSETAHERPDHLAIELEFLHFLCFKEAYAMRHHGPEQAELCREAERKFLGDHVLQWAPSFAARLQEAASAGWYRQVGALLAAFLSTEAARWECGEIEALALQPVGDLPEGSHFSCAAGPQSADDLIGQP
jgi:DMSO reductase family type II enzyme chaperone